MNDKSAALLRVPRRNVPAWERSAPILLGLSLQGGRVRVLALDPVPRAARPIWRIAPLRDDALKPEPAGMLEHEPAVVMVQMLVEPQAWRGAREQAGQRRLAHGKRIAAEVIAVCIALLRSWP